MNIKELKRVEVGYIDTPLEFMPNLTQKLGKGKLYIKRDDLTGLAFGGNKTRKLDYIVADAKEKGYTTLMTFGGVQTNHGRLTIAAAIKHGMKSILVLKGAKPEEVSGNLLLDALMGAELYFVDTTRFTNLPEEEKQLKSKEFLEQCTADIIKDKETLGEKVLSIPVGGQNEIGTAGYIEAIPELMRQMQEENLSAQHLVVGYGSTGTFAGLWLGAKYYHAPFDVIGIVIEPDFREIEDTVNFINQLSTFYEMGILCTKEDLQIELYGGDGYNVPDANTWDYIKLLAETEAVFLDPCYTGKAFFGFVDMIQKGIIPQEDNSIFLNTGGSPGLWTKEHLDLAQKVIWEGYDKANVFKA